MEAAKKNVVLIGMPGSGKTTVGRMLAERMDRPFCDMDDVVREELGIDPAVLLAERGESCFRDRETEILRRCIANRCGEVIATGGGAVLRQENVELLCKNGRLYFLDRPLESLVPTEDRPLSSTRELLEARYRERYEIYCRACHVRIEDPKTPEEAAERILQEFHSQE